jgi:polyketide cyclase/dehydrase/lipid transport protein
MKSVVELEIDVPQDTLAALFADPSNMTKWMDDLERYEPLSGEQGMPGSTYRMVPKEGTMVFVATVLSRDLPNEIRLRLDASNVVVSIRVTFSRITPDKTRFISEEEFTFKGLFGTIIGLFAGGSIRKAHRKHMDGFKRFAEQRG